MDEWHGTPVIGAGILARILPVSLANYLSLGQALQKFRHAFAVNRGLA